jgi:hypothetical protein
MYYQEKRREKEREKEKLLTSLDNALFKVFLFVCPFHGLIVAATPELTTEVEVFKK